MKLHAIRTQLARDAAKADYEDKQRPVQVDVRLKRSGERVIIGIVDGGVTGHENHHLDDFMESKATYLRAGWYPCAGTRGRWDRLWVPPSEMERLFDLLDTFYEVLR